MAGKHDRGRRSRQASRCSRCRAAPAVADRVDRRDVTAHVARHARRSDWRMAYDLSARLLAAAIARPGAVVLEGVEHLETGSPVALDLLVSALLPLLPRRDLDVLLIGFREWHARRLDPHGQVLGPSRLQLDWRAVALLAEVSLLGLSAAILKRTFALTSDAAGALQAAFSAGVVLGPEVFVAAAAGASSGRELLCALSRRMLARADDHICRRPVREVGCCPAGTPAPLLSRRARPAQPASFEHR